jgi:hypothetical protein
VDVALAVLLLIGLPSLLGWGLLGPVAPALLVVERAAMAPVLGMSLVATANFWLAMAVGLRTPAIWACSALAGAVGGGLIWAAGRDRGEAGRGQASPAGGWPAGWRARLARERTPVLLGGLGLAYYAILYAKLLSRQGPEWIAGTLHDFGDPQLHWGAATSFAFGDNFPPEHNLFPGVRFSYPFLSNFNTALFLRLGLSVPDAWYAQNLVLVTAFTLLLYALGARLGGRPAAGLWTVAFFFLTEGLGYWYFFKDLQATHLPLWTFLWHLPRDYGVIWDLNYMWGSPLLVFLTFSRGFFFGFPLAAMTLALMAVGLERPGRAAFLLAGVAAGLTPLFHTYTFLAVGLVALWLAIQSRRREWAWFFAVAGAVGLPEAVWLMPKGMPLLGPVAGAIGQALGWPPQAQEGARLLRVHVGWTKGAEPFVLFWLRNVGLFPLLAAGAFLSPGVPATAKRFCLPFVLFFVGPNLVPLAPWEYDANKLFAFWVLGMSPVIGCLVIDAWRCRAPFHRAATGAVVASVLLGGALDTFRVLTPGSPRYALFEPDGEQIAAALLARSEPRARILTGPYHHSPVFLAGRLPLLVSPAYVHKFGIQVGSREEDLYRMLRGDPGALDLIRRYRVSYALISHHEVRDFKASRTFFDTHFPRVAAAGNYVLYDLRGGGSEPADPGRATR